MVASGSKTTRITRKSGYGAMQWVRFATQIVFLVLSPQAFQTAFGGARSLVASIASGAAIDIAGFVAVLVLLCAYTLVFGRFFCGFACAFGFLGDLLFDAGTLVLNCLGKKRHVMSEALENKLRWGKYIVLVLLLIVTACGASSIVTSASPWSAFGRLVTLQPAQMGIVATVVLVLVGILMVIKERSFCEFMCPLGAIFALLPQLGVAHIKRNMNACTGCASCVRACPVSIYPPGDGKHMGECISCERCLNVCPETCTQRGSAHQGQAGRIARAVALAVLLLVLLWACGALNYLPTPADIAAALYPAE